MSLMCIRKRIACHWQCAAGKHFKSHSCIGAIDSPHERLTISYIKIAQRQIKSPLTKKNGYLSVYYAGEAPSLQT